MAPGPRDAREREWLSCRGLIRNLGEMLAQANIPRAVSQCQLAPSSPLLPLPGHRLVASQLTPTDRHAFHRSELFLERSAPAVGGGGSDRSSPTLSSVTAAGSMVRSTLDLAVAPVQPQEFIDPRRPDPRGAAGMKQWESCQQAASAKTSLVQ
jgi:hypothetical protein